MKAYRHDVSRSLNKDSLIPDFTATGILDINFKRLKEKGVKHVLIDLDLTLRKKRVYSLDPEIRNYLLKAMEDNNFESLNIDKSNYDFKILNAKSYSMVKMPYYLFHRGKINESNYNRIMFQIVISESNDAIISNDYK